ncbi:MAG: carbon-nitrogen hydrolase family protein [Hyphomicrobium sp.]
MSALRTVVQENALKIAAAQIRPVWLNKRATVAKVIETIKQAAAEEVDLLAFPEAFVSGYPFWLCRTDAASFGDPKQGDAYSRLLDASIEADSDEVKQIVEAARDYRVSVFLGFNERGSGIGRGTLYCALLKIEAEQGVLGVHRKLMPTHDERLCWAAGDAHGLRTHRISGVRVGGLCCWENWMPMARFALYCGGEELHISLWPGNAVVAEGIVSATAREGRVWSLSVHGLLSMSDIPDDFPFKSELVAEGYDVIFNGGSSLVAPDGTVVIPPSPGVEGLICYTIDVRTVYENRQLFDVTGHYYRPDIFDLRIRGDRFDAARLWR